MSSRVQKGGQVFRPVAKSRGRVNDSVSRNSSVVPEPARTSVPAPFKPASAVEAEVSVPSESTSTNYTQTTSKQADNVSTAAEQAPQPQTPLAIPSQIQPGAQRRPPTLRTAIKVGSSRQTSNTIPTKSVVLSSQASSADKITAAEIAEVSGSKQLHNAPQSSTDIPAEKSHLFINPAVSSEPTLVHASASVVGAEAGPSRIHATEPTTSQINLKQKKPRKRTSEPQNAVPSADGEHEDMDTRMARPRRRRKSAASNNAPDDETQEQSGAETGDSRPQRRRRQQSYAESGGTSGSESEGRRKRRRRSTTASSTSTRQARSRTTSDPILDADTAPGQDLDPTVVTMAEICQDTGQGRISSKAAIIQRNHIAWKSANKEKRERMRMIMEAKKYDRKEFEGDNTPATSAPNEPDAVEDAAEAGIESNADNDSSAPTEIVETPVENSNGDDFNYRQALQTNRFSVQVRIGPNGETIIDEESLHVDRTENEETTEHYQHVEESDQTKFTNSSSYQKKLRGSRWSAEETELFFHALSQFGENYELISFILPGRDRKACKNKFKAEDKKNSDKITYCLTHRIPYDMQTLSRLTGKDFTGPTPEIRAPVVTTLAEPIIENRDIETASEDAPAVKIRKKSRTPSAIGDVEVLGDIDSFES